MKRAATGHGRTAALIGAGVAGVLLLLLVAVNLAVQSAGFKERIDRALTRATGLDIAVARTGFTPWGGLTVDGVTLGDPDGARTGTIRSIRLHLRLLPLLGKRVEIRQMEIIEPSVTIAGSKVADTRGEEAPPTTRTPAPSPPAATPETPAPTPAPSDPAPDTRPGSPEDSPDPRPWSVAIETVVLRQGRFLLTDTAGRELLDCRDIVIRAVLREDGAADGRIDIEKVLVRRAVPLDRVTSPFTIKHGLLRLPEIRADIAGGRATGSLETRTDRHPMDYQADLAIRDARVADLIDSAGLPRDRIAGRLGGEITLAGLIGDWRTANGRGAIEIRDGEIQQIEMFQTIGQALRLEELVRFNLESARAAMTITDGTTRIDPLEMRSPNMRMVAAGEILPDGRLDMDARLHLHAKIRKRLPDFVKDNMRESDEDGYLYLPFEITGTVSSPRTNLVSQLVGDSLEDRVRGVLRDFFGD